MTIQLEKDVHTRLRASIKQFFATHLDDEIGDMKADRVLEFCLKEIGPSIYNQAIADAQAYFQDKASELGDVKYEAEYAFWNKQ